MLKTALLSSASLPKDLYYNQVVLALSSNRVNNANNETILDSGINNITITKTGTGYVGSNTPFANRWSVYFDGNNDYLTISDHASFTLDGDFTIEGWIYVNAFSNTWGKVFFDTRPASTNGSPYIIMSTGGSNFGADSFIVTMGGVTYVSTLRTVTPQKWHHLAITRSSGTIRLFIDGVLDSPTYTNSVTLDANRIVLGKGTFETGVDNTWWDGYLSNVRVLKGTALYTSTFTPSTVPLEAITNTSLLICASASISDKSSYNHSISINGECAATTYSPFSNTNLPYSQGKLGSMYFDGSSRVTGNSSTATTFGTGSFTVEMWVYVPSGGTYRGVFSQRANDGNSTSAGSLTITPTNTILYWTNAAIVTYSNTLPLNQWFHLAFVRNGSTSTIYVNGKSNGASGTDNFNLTASQMCFGANLNGTEPFTGMMSDIRVTKGFALYTADFSIPTAPLSITNDTSLALKFGNDSIYDTSRKLNISTINDAKVDTSVKKTSNGSITFDGTGDILRIPNYIAKQYLNVRNADFCLETWVYPTAVGAIRGIYGKRANPDTDVQHFSVFLQADNTVRFQATGNNSSWAFNITSTSTVSLNQWIHVCVAKSNNAYVLYINGVIEAAITVSSISIPDNSADVSIGAPGISNYFLHGKLDGFRITRDTSRYTNFTPSLVKLSNITNTSLLTLQDSTIIDNSSNNFSITNVGSIATSAVGPFSSDNYSASFDGSTQHLTVSTHSALNLSSGNWTIECWVNFNNISTNNNSYIVNKDGVASTSYQQYSIKLNTSGKIEGAAGNGASLSPTITTITSSTTVQTNKWYHISFSRINNILLLHIDGKLEASTPLTVTMVDGGKSLFIGYASGEASSYRLNGKISNLRIVKGTGVYSSFTPPISLPTK